MKSQDIEIDGEKLKYHPRAVLQWLSMRNHPELRMSLTPSYVEISPTNICNHRCSFCALDFMKDEIHELQPEKLGHTLKELCMFNVNAVMYGGEGEPLLWKHLPTVIENYSGKGFPSIGLTTNLSVYNHDLYGIISKKCAWIKISFNAGDRRSYSVVHGVNSTVFDRVKENICKLVNFRDGSGSSTIIGAQMVVVPENKRSVDKFIKTMKYLGLDYVVIKPYSHHLETISQRYSKIFYGDFFSIKTWKRHETENFKVYIRQETAEKWDKKMRGYSKCHAVPFLWAYISSNGDISACSCHLRDKKFTLGNIHESMFHEIWMGQRRAELAEHVFNDLDVNTCRVNCRMDKVNEYLERIAHPQQCDAFI